ncbi:MAG: PPC domain-containing protein [Leptolyngbyaceae cyanobacterium]
MVSRPDVDIYRFRASKGTIDIISEGLGKKSRVTLYETKRSFRKALQTIGESEFRDVPRKQLNRFLNRVRFSASGEGRVRTYSTEVSSNNYFLVVSSRAKKQQQYKLRFVSNPEVDLGAIKTGDIGGTDTEDTFEFTLENRQKVSFTLDGLSSNADLNLLDSNRVLLKTIDATDTTAGSILRNLGDGTYYIQVASTSSTETNYTLTTTTSRPDRKLLHGVNGRKPGEQGELHHNQGTFRSDEVDRIANGITINGSAPPDSRREDLRGHLNDNYTGDVAQESVGANGTTLRSQHNGTRHSGYVGYSTHSPDYDNVSIDVDNNEAEEWYTNRTLPPSLQYQANLKPVNTTNPTVLDATVGYVVSFAVSVDDDPKNILTPGFTVLAVSSDGRSAIELAFTSTTILAHSPTFTPEERVIPTTFEMESMNRYDLYIVERPEGITYELSANGEPILSGPTRNYIFDPMSVTPPVSFNKYETPNFLFFGTKGNQTNATFTLGEASVFT